MDGEIPEGQVSGSKFDRETGRITYTDETGKKVGQLQLSFTNSGKAVIVDVGVDKDQQRKGIGTRLTEEAERVAEAEGAREIGAIAQPDYLSLLKKRGYITTGFFATKKLKE